MTAKLNMTSMCVTMRNWTMYVLLRESINKHALEEAVASLSERKK